MGRDAEESTGATLERTDAGGTLRFRGALDHFHVGPLWLRCAKALTGFRGGSLVLDFREVSRVDTLGITLIHRVERTCREMGITLERRNIPDSVGKFLRYVEERSPVEGETAPAARHKGPVSSLGAWAVGGLEDFFRFVRFIGAFAVTSAAQFLRMERALFEETARQLALVGVRAVPLLVILSILFGTIMVFQAMSRMSTFGGGIYIADLVVISVTHEMGPLVTAIILAGRSASAFAAELGTMKLNREIDALAVMDVDVTGYLVLPRVCAIAVAGPVLVMISDAFGIVGGLLASAVVVGLPPESYLGEARTVLTAPDIFTGLIKGAAFALLVGLIGCFRGLQTRLGPGSIGVQTTSAVVTGILLVVFADAFFSFIFPLYNW